MFTSGCLGAFCPAPRTVPAVLLRGDEPRFADGEMSAHIAQGRTAAGAFGAQDGIRACLVPIPKPPRLLLGPRVISGNSTWLLRSEGRCSEHDGAAGAGPRCPSPCQIKGGVLGQTPLQMPKRGSGPRKPGAVDDSDIGLGCRIQVVSSPLDSR